MKPQQASTESVARYLASVPAMDLRADTPFQDFHMRRAHTQGLHTFCKHVPIFEFLEQRLRSFACAGYPAPGSLSLLRAEYSWLLRNKFT